MSRHQKLVDRIRSKPRDFTWHELQQLLSGFGYREHEGDGSRRKFIHSATGVVISLHQPHPGNELKPYQVRDILDHLRQEGYL